MTQHDNGVPDFLRRDANNRAPFMDVTVDGVKWEAYCPHCVQSPAGGLCGDRTVHGTVTDRLPPAGGLCEDEGCPQHGTPHVCVTKPKMPWES